jgi:hypothetical protein
MSLDLIFDSAGAIYWKEACEAVSIGGGSPPAHPAGGHAPGACQERGGRMAAAGGTSILRPFRVCGTLEGRRVFRTPGPTGTPHHGPGSPK